MIGEFRSIWLSPLNQVKSSQSPVEPTHFTKQKIALNAPVRIHRQRMVAVIPFTIPVTAPKLSVLQSGLAAVIQITQSRRRLQLGSSAERLAAHRLRELCL